MNHLFKCKSLLLFALFYKACSTAEKTDIDKANDKKVTSTTTDQTGEKKA